MRSGGDPDQPAERVGDPALRQPVERRAGVAKGFGSGESLGGNDHQRRRWIEVGDGGVECLTIDVGQDRDAVALLAAAERIDQQGGAERRAADADVEQPGDVAESSRLDGVNQCAHPGVAVSGECDCVGRTGAALGERCSAAAGFGRIDQAAGKQKLLRIAKPARLDQRLGAVDECCGQVVLAKSKVIPATASDRRSARSGSCSNKADKGATSAACSADQDSGNKGIAAT